MRYDKLDLMFSAFLHLALIYEFLRYVVRTRSSCFLSSGSTIAPCISQNPRIVGEFEVGKHPHALFIEVPFHVQEVKIVYPGHLVGLDDDFVQDVGRVRCVPNVAGDLLKLDRVSSTPGSVLKSTLCPAPSTGCSSTARSMFPWKRTPPLSLEVAPWAPVVVEPNSEVHQRFLKFLYSDFVVVVHLDKRTHSVLGQAVAVVLIPNPLHEEGLENVGLVAGRLSADDTGHKFPQRGFRVVTHYIA